MATPETAPSSDPLAELQVKIIWLALLGSHFIYLGMIRFLHPPAQEATALVTPLTAVAIVNAAAALFVNGLILGEAQLDKQIAALKASGVAKEELETQVLARGRVLSIVSWALAESITLM